VNDAMFDGAYSVSVPRVFILITGNMTRYIMPGDTGTPVLALSCDSIHARRSISAAATEWYNIYLRVLVLVIALFEIDTLP